MTKSMIIHVNTEVFTTGLVNKPSTGIDHVLVNKIIIYTRTKIVYARRYVVFKRPNIDAQFSKIKRAK